MFFMKNKVMKRIIASVGIATCCLTLTATPVTTLPVQAAAPTDETVDPAAEILEWVYRITDGKVYKRLLNCTTQQWAGPWIYVGEAE